MNAHKRISQLFFSKDQTPPNLSKYTENGHFFRVNLWSSRAPSPCRGRQMSLKGQPKLASSHMHPYGFTTPQENPGRWFFTFQTAYPPEPRVGEGPGILLVLVVGIVLADVGRAVADDSSGVEPVIRPYCHRHQAEGGERPHGGEEDLDPLLTHHAFIWRMEEGKRGDLE